jgi:ribosome-associated protein
VPRRRADREPAQDLSETEEPAPSKSQRKRDALALRRLGVELVALPAAELAALPLPERLRDAIVLARGLRAHGAVARQQQYIGKLLRASDVAAIAAALAAKELSQQEAARGFHRLERWRDRLVEEGEPALQALIAVHPALDAAALRPLIASARAERAALMPPRATRELFRVLRAALESTAPAG